MPPVSSKGTPLASTSRSRVGAVRRRNLAHGVRSSPYATAANTFKRTIVSGLKVPNWLSTARRYKEPLVVYDQEALEEGGPLAWVGEAMKNRVPGTVPQQVMPSAVPAQSSQSAAEAADNINADTDVDSDTEPDEPDAKGKEPQRNPRALRRESSMIREAIEKIAQSEEVEEEDVQKRVQNGASTAHDLPASKDDDGGDDGDGSSDDSSDDDESETDGEDILPASRKPAVDVHVEEAPREEIVHSPTNHSFTVSTAQQPAPCPPLEEAPAFPPCDGQTAANPTLPTAPSNCGMDLDHQPSQMGWHEPLTLQHDHWQSRSWIPLAAQQHNLSTSETPVASTSQISGLPFPTNQHHAGSDSQPWMVFHDSNLQPEMFFEDSTLIGAYKQALNAEFTVPDHMDLDLPSIDPGVGNGIPVSAHIPSSVSVCNGVPIQDVSASHPNFISHHPINVTHPDHALVPMMDVDPVTPWQHSHTPVWPLAQNPIPHSEPPACLQFPPFLPPDPPWPIAGHHNPAVATGPSCPAPSSLWHSQQLAPTPIAVITDPTEVLDQAPQQAAVRVDCSGVMTTGLVQESWVLGRSSPMIYQIPKNELIVDDATQWVTYQVQVRTRARAKQRGSDRHMMWHQSGVPSDTAVMMAKRHIKDLDDAILGLARHMDEEEPLHKRRRLGSETDIVHRLHGQWKQAQGH